jgi:transcriptional regulator with AAA-type ATPase domain
MWPAAAERSRKLEKTVGTDAAVTTTQPSASTGQDRSAGRVTHLSWVFPSPLSTNVTGRQVIGREESCEIVLRGTEISRRHAELWVDGPVVAIRDLQSRNGVFVNGARCTDAPLSCGDVVRVGEWVGVAVAAAPSFSAIAPGWFGGTALAEAVAQVRLMPTELAIVVEGETGTGKEGAARAIHDWSDRRGPFVAVNCAALPAHLAEAELFGYRKGAFTGADKASPGLFRAAHQGTIFLDEVLELPLPLQAKLLRVLEQREVLPIGETAPVAVDLRVVAATQEPLAAAVADRRFRADLRARLDGLTVVLPPLRARREDIVPLFLQLARQHGGGRIPAVEPRLAEALCLHGWPLNVRELLLLVRRLLGVHGHEPLLKRSHLPERILAGAPSHGAPGEVAPKVSPRPWRKTDDEAEFESLVQALQENQGSVARAAAAIGVNRARAYRLLSAHPDFSRDEMRGQGRDEEPGQS